VFTEAGGETNPSRSSEPFLPADGGRPGAGRGRQVHETVVLDRDPDEPELWSFGHVIDGAVGKRGRLRHDPSTHETTLTSGHGGGLYTTAALIVHLACLRTEGVPSSFVYDVATRRIERNDCSPTWESRTA
jgi:hypothetical protein